MNGSIQAYVVRHISPMFTGEGVIVRDFLPSITEELFGVSGLKAHCSVQVFPLCMIEENVSFGLVMLLPPGKKCFWLMPILS